MPDIRHAEVQQAIADAYIATGNAERAVIAAGYSPRYARGNAYKLLAHSGVQALIDERNDAIADDRIADMTEINAFWTETMRDHALDIKDRLKASELRARAAGGFLDRVDIGGSVPVVIVGDEDV